MNENVKKMSLGIAALASATAMADDQFHIVQEGDTFSGIVEKYQGQFSSHQYKIRYKMFKDSNRMDNYDLIYPGQKIQFPKIESLSIDSDSEHIIQKDESLSKIAMSKFPNHNFKKVVQAIKELNPSIEDVNIIYPGNKIQLPTGKQIAESREYIQNTTKIVKNLKTRVKKEEVTSEAPVLKIKVPKKKVSKKTVKQKKFTFTNQTEKLFKVNIISKAMSELSVDEQKVYFEYFNKFTGIDNLEDFKIELESLRLFAETLNHHDMEDYLIHILDKVEETTDFSPFAKFVTDANTWASKEKTEKKFTNSIERMISNYQKKLDEN